MTTTTAIEGFDRCRCGGLKLEGKPACAQCRNRVQDDPTFRGDCDDTPAGERAKWAGVDARRYGYAGRRSMYSNQRGRW